MRVPEKRRTPAMFFTFPGDTRWNAARQAACSGSCGGSDGSRPSGPRPKAASKLTTSSGPGLKRASPTEAPPTPAGRGWECRDWRRDLGRVPDEGGADRPGAS
jgi:hypothetical protein